MYRNILILRKLFCIICLIFVFITFIYALRALTTHWANIVVVSQDELENASTTKTEIIIKEVVVYKENNFEEDFYKKLAKEQAEAEELEVAKWDAKMREYPDATYIWLFLTKECGYSNYVAAGILGNFMNETGGNTLNIVPDMCASHNGNDFYGIAMWHIGYYPSNKLYKKSLRDQLTYLEHGIIESEDVGDPILGAYTIKEAFGDKYDYFCSVLDCQEAAELFRVYYEKCSSLSSKTRKINALKAYQYFVD